MRSALAMGVALLATLLVGTPASAQRPPAPPQHPTITSTLDFQLSIVEREFVSTADAMPEDKYSFAPTNGEFKGVRTFAQQVKHVARTNMRFFDAILGQAPPKAANRFEAENGPDSIKTKAQIMKYLRDSFALGHKAIATIDAKNAYQPVKNPPIPFLNTPAAIATFAPAHAMDHYGQMVEYLRMNGIIPPASRRSPPANPPAK
jgi:uncharacterized damage-inducible protein DinB